MSALHLCSELVTLIIFREMQLTLCALNWYFNFLSSYLSPSASKLMIVIVRKYVLGCKGSIKFPKLWSSYDFNGTYAKNCQECQLCWMWCVEVRTACKSMNSIVSNLSGYDWNMIISPTLKMHQYHMFQFSPVSFTMFLVPRSDCSLLVHV